jgi:hypothetical protein
LVPTAREAQFNEPAPEIVLANVVPAALLTVTAPLTVSKKVEFTVNVAPFPVNVIEVHAAFAVTVTVNVGARLTMSSASGIPSASVPLSRFQVPEAFQLPVAFDVNVAPYTCLKELMVNRMKAIAITLKNNK